MTDVPSSAPLTPEQQRRGMRYAYLSQVVGVHLQQTVAFSAITPLFIKRLGGSDLQAMLPATLMGLTYAVQIPFSLMVPPAGRKRFLVRCWFASSFPMLIASLLALWLGPGMPAVWTVLGGLLLCMILTYAGSAFWFPLLYDVVPEDQRGRFFGRLRAQWGVAYLAVSMTAGLFLGRDPAVWRFCAVFMFVTLLQFLREPLAARIPERATPPASGMGWRGDVRHVLGRREVRTYCAYYSLLMFLAGFLGQPLVLYMRQLGFSARDNTLIFATMTIGSILSQMVAGVLADRFGSKRVFMGVHVALCALALVIAAVGEFPIAVAAPVLTFLMIAAGATNAASTLANTAQIFHMAPQQGKPFFMSLLSSVFYIGGSLAPLAMGAILDSRLREFHVAAGPVDLDIFQLCFVAAGVGLLAAMSLLRMIPDVKAQKAIRDEEAELGE